MEKEGIPAHLILLIKNWRRKPLPREASATGPTEPWNRSRALRGNLSRALRTSDVALPLRLARAGELLPSFNFLGIGTTGSPAVPAAAHPGCGRIPAHSL